MPVQRARARFAIWRNACGESINSCLSNKSVAWPQTSTTTSTTIVHIECKQNAFDRITGTCYNYLLTYARTPNTSSNYEPTHTQANANCSVWLATCSTIRRACGDADERLPPSRTSGINVIYFRRRGLPAALSAWSIDTNPTTTANNSSKSGGDSFAPIHRDPAQLNTQHVNKMHLDSLDARECTSELNIYGITKRTQICSALQLQHRMYCFVSSSSSSSLCFCVCAPS